MNDIRLLFVAVLLIVLHFFPERALSQVSIKDSAINLAIVEVTYSGLFPAGDMVDRFGFTSTVGMNIAYKHESNFYVSTGAQLMFGSNVKEDSILNNLLLPGGFLITDGGDITEARILQTGMVVPLMVGKIFPVFASHNKNSGIYVELGTQFIQHKIQVDAIGENVSSLSKEFQKGYDRLTNGFGLRERIGYRFFSSKTLINFSFGFEFSQNFTQNRRSINIDTGMRDDKKRLDLLNGFSVSWTYPLYRQAPQEHYFY